MSSRIFDRTSELMAPGPTAFKSETKLSINSRDAISVKKWAPPFFTHVSVSYFMSAQTPTRKKNGYFPSHSVR